MFQQPKIYLIDTDQTVHEKLLKKWSSIDAGTLGTPYEVSSDSNWVPVVQHQTLSNFEESDLVIIDFESKNLSKKSSGGKHAPPGEIDLWAKCDKGWIDARVRNALLAKADLDRIIENGGVLIIFAAPDSPMSFQWGYTDYRDLLTTSRSIDGGIWNITSSLNQLNISTESGSIINITDSSPTGLLLQRHLHDSKFTCTFESKWRNNKNFHTIATNKYGASVAAVINSPKGLIFLLPQISNKAYFIDELLSDTLPEILPSLFPDIEKGKWTHRPEYEIEQIKTLTNQKDLLIKSTQAALDEIQEKIDEQRIVNGWLHDLLTETGDKLVDAIKNALAELGFKKVIDMDEVRDTQGKSRREDLRLEDEETLLIIDIKGVGGRASDEDIMQANKHVMINMKELKRTNIQGLSIINQQRHLPPLERDNIGAFRQEILDFAGETDLGLLTSFDLYRMIVNKKKHDWLPEWVKPILYNHKRITVVPTHYRYLGTISKVFTGMFGLHILENEINTGDKLSVEGEIYFSEITVETIQVNNVDVKTAQLGDPAGFIWPESEIKLKEGMRVYAIPKLLHGAKT